MLIKLAPILNRERNDLPFGCRRHRGDLGVSFIYGSADVLH